MFSLHTLMLKYEKLLVGLLVMFLKLLFGASNISF